MSHLSNYEDEQEWIIDGAVKQLDDIKEQLKGMDKKTPQLKDSSVNDKIQFLIWINDNAIIPERSLK